MRSEFLASSWKNFRDHSILLKQYPGTLWYCFVGKNFVVRLSTTKTKKILHPEKFPLYGMLYACLLVCTTVFG